MKKQWFVLFLGFMVIASPVMAGDGGIVSVEEFNKLRGDYEEMKKEVQLLKQALEQRPKVQQTKATAASGEYVSVEEFEALKDQVDEVRPGLSNVVVTGYGFGSFTDAENADSNFTAGFNPIFLYQMNDRILFEGELELELEDGVTATALEYADVSYIVNDYITLGAGKFLSPFGIFRERLHPKWINKLPDQPLGYKSGASRLAPSTQIGAQVRGGVPLPIGESKMGYTFYLSNGPTVQTGANNAGQLSFTNTNDNNNNKAFGGRVGILPIPELEVGYSWQMSRVGASGSAYDKIDALLQEVDLSYVRDSELIRGAIDLRSEWIWSDVDPVNYGTGGAFKNRRSARYLQAAYRPSKLDLPIAKDLEGVFRFDQIEHPSHAPTLTDQKRYTWGLNYRLNPSTVVKAAYQKDDQDSTGSNQNSFMAEVASGF